LLLNYAPPKWISPPSGDPSRGLIVENNNGLRRKGCSKYRATCIDREMLPASDSNKPIASKLHSIDRKNVSNTGFVPLVADRPDRPIRSLESGVSIRILWGPGKPRVLRVGVQRSNFFLKLSKAAPMDRKHQANGAEFRVLGF
jgi:hypothetical protein